MTPTIPINFGHKVYLNLVNSHLITTEFSIPEAAGLLRKPVWLLGQFAREDESIASAARRFHRDITSFGVEVPHVIEQAFESAVSGELEDVSDLTPYFRTVADVMILGVSEAAGQKIEDNNPKLKRLSDDLRSKYGQGLKDYDWDSKFASAWAFLEGKWSKGERWPSGGGGVGRYTKEYKRRSKIIREIFLGSSDRSAEELGKKHSLSGNQVNVIKREFITRLGWLLRQSKKK